MTGKYTILATELEKDILAGMYGLQGGLPSVGELAQKWNLSPNTVKSALSLLEGKCLIEKRGTGYYVCRIPTVMTQYVPPAHIRLQFDQKESYCVNHGPVKKAMLPEHLAEKWGYTTSERVTYRVQVSGELAEGNAKPLQITYRYYFLTLSEEKIQRMQDESTYDPMWSDPDIATDLNSSDEIVSRLATEGERDLLNLPEGTPVTSVFESIRDKSGRLLMAQEIVLSTRTTLIFNYQFVNRP